MILEFDNDIKKDRYLYNFKNNNAFGFLYEKHDIIPIIILDLAPEFNISKTKLKKYDIIISEIIEQANIKPYITYIYKNPITKKKNIENDTDIFASLYFTCKELSYVIQNFYSNYQSVLFICLGKYREYSYLINMIVSHLRNEHNEINICKIHNHHISSIIEINNQNTYNQIINGDINRIIKTIDLYR